MEKKPNKPRHFTFMVIPHDGSGPTFSFRIPHFGLYLTIGAIIFSGLIVASSVVYSSMLTRKLAHYHKAIAKNVQQQKVIDSFAEKTDEVTDAIVQLEQQDNKLRKLLGLKHWRSKISLSKKAVNIEVDKSAEIADEFSVADKKLQERHASLTELKKWVGEVQKRYANTPSIWPTRGHIVSAFGYRVYPWRGFHSGLDISGRYGAPVRVTAKGVVTHIGWRKGYGKTVIVDHGHGKSTLYAHLSRYAVKRGEKVNKGQIICYIGNTGYSTGPHLHYEVRKASKPVNPYHYLDLNVLSASRIWQK